LAWIQKLSVFRCLTYRSDDLTAPAFIQQFRYLAMSIDLLRSADVHRKLQSLKPGASVSVVARRCEVSRPDRG
jgi:hypothetical protein